MTAKCKQGLRSARRESYWQTNASAGRGGKSGGVRLGSAGCRIPRVAQPDVAGRQPDLPGAGRTLRYLMGQSRCPFSISSISTRLLDVSTKHVYNAQGTPMLRARTY